MPWHSGSHEIFKWSGYQSHLTVLKEDLLSSLNLFYVLQLSLLRHNEIHLNEFKKFLLPPFSYIWKCPLCFGFTAWFISQVRNFTTGQKSYNYPLDNLVMLCQEGRSNVKEVWALQHTKAVKSNVSWKIIGFWNLFSSPQSVRGHWNSFVC